MRAPSVRPSALARATTTHTCLHSQQLCDGGCHQHHNTCQDSSHVGVYVPDCSPKHPSPHSPSRTMPSPFPSPGPSPLSTHPYTYHTLLLATPIPSQLRGGGCHQHHNACCDPSHVRAHIPGTVCCCSVALSSHSHTRVTLTACTHTHTHTDRWPLQDLPRTPDWDFLLFY
jgi:hypothetical protein